MLRKTIYRKKTNAVTSKKLKRPSQAATPSWKRNIVLRESIMLVWRLMAWSLTSAAAYDSRLGVIGLQLNVPLYLGGSIDSRVRQAVANQEKARQDLETARR